MVTAVELIAIGALVGGLLVGLLPHRPAKPCRPTTPAFPLVDGQGNFGSIDDDPAAAMRYTEARLARLAEEMLSELDNDTVDFESNYEPDVDHFIEVWRQPGTVSAGGEEGVDSSA